MTRPLRPRVCCWCDSCHRTGAQGKATCPPPAPHFPAPYTPPQRYPESVLYCFFYISGKTLQQTHTHTHTHTRVLWVRAHTHTHTHTRHTQNFPLNPDAPSELNNFQPTTMVKDRSTKQSLKWVSYYNLTYFVCSNFPLCVTIFKKHKRKMKNSFQINLRLPTKWKQKRPYTISHGINVYLSRP